MKRAIFRKMNIKEMLNYVIYVKNDEQFKFLCVDDTVTSIIPFNQDGFFFDCYVHTYINDSVVSPKIIKRYNVHQLYNFSLYLYNNNYYRNK